MELKKKFQTSQFFCIAFHFLFPNKVWNEFWVEISKHELLDIKWDKKLYIWCDLKYSYTSYMSNAICFILGLFFFFFSLSP